LKIVGLLDRAEDKVKTYSHGMKQRLGIAQALLGKPEFIILDEPTTGLDPIGIKEVRDLIRLLSTEQSITVFLSSHLLSEIEQTATSMAIISAGRLVVQGNVKELLEEQETLVRIDARPQDTAVRIINENRLATIAGFSGEIIEARMPSSDVPKLARLLVDGGVEVRALIPRRSLEEYFLALTEQADVPRKDTA
jgi:ABC-2 type transport system ATP-binding protein